MKNGKHRVFWVNTIGTRPPGFNLLTARRGLEKIRVWLCSFSPKSVVSPSSLNAEPSPQTPNGRNLSLNSDDVSPSQFSPSLTAQSSQIPQPRILQPIMFPWFRSRFDRWLNRKLLACQLNRALAHETNVIAITTLPIVADLLGERKFFEEEEKNEEQKKSGKREKNAARRSSPPKASPQVSNQGPLHAVTRWIYYCVDDWSRWPGMDAKPLAEMEARLIQNVDQIVVVGENLRDRIRSSGRDSVLLTHGVDLDFWGFDAINENRSRFPDSLQKHFPAKISQTKEATPEVTPDATLKSNLKPNPESPSKPTSDSPKEKTNRFFTRNLPRPIFVFWGLLDERLEPEILAQVAQDVPGSSILMAGPVAAPEVVAQMEKIPGLKLLGNIPYEKLPQLASEADVLLMPYRKNESTEQIQPLKMTEYLASGKPAVVRDLRAAQDWKDALDVADSPAAFSELARRRLKTGLPESQKVARRRLKNESWEQKAADFEKLILEDEYQNLPPY